MAADFFFRMGSTHAICQDYAVAGEAGGRQYALLADGCSGVSTPGQPGSPFTDFGARFLTRAAQLRIADMARAHYPAEAIIEHAAALARQAEFPATALDATLLAAVTTEDGSVMVYQTGDGVIAARRRDGDLEYRRIEFPSGMPLYLSYMLNHARLETLLRASATVSRTERSYSTANGWCEPKTYTEPTVTLMPRPFSGGLEYPIDEYDLVLLMSDGIETFQTKEGETVPLEMVLDQLFAFKGFVGQFLVRRCTRFVQKFCTENGWSHADDFSVAGIYLGEPREP